MHLSGKLKLSAVLPLAVVLFAGCCMKRDIVIVDDKINKIIAEQKDMKQAIDRLDSLFYAESEESVKLRAEVRSSLSELLEQFRMSQANISDLQNMMTTMGGREPARFPATPQIVQADSSDSTAPPVVPGIDCQELYDESFINIRRGQYEEAIQGFTDYLKYCGGRESADNARFWIGEAYYSMEKFRQAIDEFAQLLKLHPDSEKRSGALYKMARSYEELGQKKDAKETFQKLVDDFPGTLEAEQAQEKLKELK